MTRAIIHVDMDYFYAAIEEREDPSLSGKAVVVCMYSGRGGGSGSVSTCNYPARDAGIYSGMPCSRAKSIDPDAIFLPVRKEFYTSVSESVMEILRQYADTAPDGTKTFEQVSIDEAFLDITKATDGNLELAQDIGMRIKEEVKEHEHITCSVGVGPNKLIAKMASSVRKPDGITIIKPEDVGDFLKGMELTSLWGIGKVTGEKLEQIGIKTTEQLAAHDVIDLITVFGKKKGTWLKKAAAGVDESVVKEKSGSEQIGRIATLPQNSRDTELIFQTIDKLVEDVIDKLDSRGLSFRLVTVTAITSDFKTHTNSRTLNHHVSDRNILRDTAREMLIAFISETTLDLRRIGVRVGNLQKSSGQSTLFDYLE
ncbi:MAG: DNA polymerase IV [Methanosarcinaceae archaeon]|nr:DNA polymerase IV [Methanosarcinaceae archaeon]